MNITAKFYVTGVVPFGSEYGQPGVTLTLNAGPYEKGGNEAWSKATPSGTLTMNITNPAAIEAMPLGKEFDVIFTPVE